VTVPHPGGRAEIRPARLDAEPTRSRPSAQPQGKGGHVPSRGLGGTFFCRFSTNGSTGPRPPYEPFPSQPEAEKVWTPKCIGLSGPRCTSATKEFSLRGFQSPFASPKIFPPGVTRHALHPRCPRSPAAENRDARSRRSRRVNTDVDRAAHVFVCGEATLPPRLRRPSGPGLRAPPLPRTWPVPRSRRPAAWASTPGFGAERAWGRVGAFVAGTRPFAGALRIKIRRHVFSSGPECRRHSCKPLAETIFGAKRSPRRFGCRVAGPWSRGAGSRPGRGGPARRLRDSGNPR